METKTKWIIGVTSAVIVGVIGFVTKKHWMPIFKKKTSNGEVYVPPVKSSEQLATEAAKRVILNNAKVKKEIITMKEPQLI